MKELYLAGKIAELLAAFEGMKGVEEVVAGRAKASGELEVKCVRVQYNPKRTDICELLKKYFNEGVNPYIIAEDPLEQAAVIYKAAEDVPQIEYYARFMQNRGAEPGAALGNMILNDTMPEENELRRVQINYGRLQEFLQIKLPVILLYTAWTTVTVYINAVCFLKSIQARMRHMSLMTG